MRVKAEAYKNYGDAALVSMVLEVLPHLAGEVMMMMIVMMTMMTMMTMVIMIMIMMKSGGEPAEADPGDCSSWRQWAAGKKPASEQPGQYPGVGAREKGGQIGEEKLLPLDQWMMERLDVYHHHQPTQPLGSSRSKWG